MSNPFDGPWTKGTRNDAEKIYGSGGRHIASVLGTTRGRRRNPYHEESQKAARLMAAAPVMRDTLKHPSLARAFQIMNWFASGKSQEQYQRAEPLAILAEVYQLLAIFHTEAQKALKKAEGRK